MLLLLSGCLPSLYDRDYYLEALQRWVDDDLDGFRDVDGDCDDASWDVNPAADEICNGLDDDCEGSVDVQALDAQVWYQDADHDGQGNPDLKYVTCVQPTGFVATADDCDDGAPDVYLGAPESCDDSRDANCDGQPGDLDADGDGFPACLDCQDALYEVNPGALEVCNGGVDDDCDGVADGADALGAVAWYEDADDDGHGAGPLIAQCQAPADYVLVDDDCDDTNADAHPDAAEVCDNGFDDDCDGGANGCRVEGVLAAEATITAEAEAGFAAVFGVGDLNGDGDDDLVVGGVTDAWSRGAAWVVPGPVGGEADVDSVSVATLSMPVDGDLSMTPLGAMGDLDADGIDTWAFVATDAALAEVPNVVYLLDARTSDAELPALATASLSASLAGSVLGHAAASGDITGDGTNEFLASAPLQTGSDGVAGGGAVFGFTSPAGALQDLDAGWIVYGTGGGGLGDALAVADWNTDGVGDVLVGGGDTADARAAYVFEGPLAGVSELAAADVRVSRADGAAFGCSARHAGDVDGDGRADVWIGASEAEDTGVRAGALYLLTDLTYSGEVADLAVATLFGTHDDRLGASTAAMDTADLDGDGADDLALGAPDHSDGAPSTGKIWLFYAPFAGDLSTADAAAWYAGDGEAARAGGRVAVVGDLDGDGHLEIALTEGGGESGLDARLGVFYGYTW